MTKVKHIEKVTGTVEVNGQEFEKKEIKTVCESCGSDKVSTEGWGKNPSSWTCWSCEVSLKNSSKDFNSGKERTGVKFEVSLEARGNEVSPDKDNALLENDRDDKHISLEDSVEGVEIKQMIDDFTELTEVERETLKAYVQTGSLRGVAKLLNKDHKAVKKTLTRLQNNGKLDHVKDEVRDGIVGKGPTKTFFRTKGRIRA